MYREDPPFEYQAIMQMVTVSSFINDVMQIQAVSDPSPPLPYEVTETTPASFRDIPKVFRTMYRVRKNGTPNCMTSSCFCM